MAASEKSEKDETNRIRKEMMGGMEMSPPSGLFLNFFQPKKDAAPDPEKKEENHFKNT